MEAEKQALEMNKDVKLAIWSRPWNSGMC